MEIQKLLLKRKTALINYQSEIMRFSVKEPIGRIRIQTRDNKRISFYHITGGRICETKYIPRQDIKTISQLLQKRYYKSALPIVNKELSEIDQILKIYKQDKAIADIFNTFNSMCRDYIKFLELPDDEYVRQWLKKPFKPNPYPIEQNDFITMNNEHVRSKSELIIANCLKEFDIPYRYECPFNLYNTKTLYPDFTILDVKNKKEIIWEHFGKIDSDSYREKFFEKLKAYASVGITPGYGMIVTFEDYKHPLSVSIVRTQIEKILNK